MDKASIFNKRLNKTIPIPLYYQLKEILLDFIQKSPESTPLPTEARICEHFEISRSTVRQAFGELSAEGLVVRHKGRGTMVAPVKKIEQEFLVVLESFNDEMQDKGLEPWTKVLELSLDECDSKVCRCPWPSERYAWGKTPAPQRYGYRANGAGDNMDSHGWE